MINIILTNTTTATIPPIRAWSGPVWPARALGSREENKISHKQCVKHRVYIEWVLLKISTFLLK